MSERKDWAYHAALKWLTDNRVTYPGDLVYSLAAAFRAVARAALRGGGK